MKGKIGDKRKSICVSAKIKIHALRIAHPTQKVGFEQNFIQNRIHGLINMLKFT